MVFMPGRRQRSASFKQVAEMTKDVDCAVVRAIAGCDEANLISECSSNTELDTTDLQQHCVFRAGHGLQREHMYGVTIIEPQDIQHQTMSEPFSSEPYHSEPGTGTPHIIYISKLYVSLKLASNCL